MAATVHALTATSTAIQYLTTYADYNGADNKIEVIGHGGAGSARQSSTVGGVGGGAGAYARANNFNVPANSRVGYLLPAGGAPGGTAVDAWFGTKNMITNSGFPNGTNWAGNQGVAQFAQTDRLGGSKAANLLDNGNVGGNRGIYQTGIVKPASALNYLSACVEVKREYVNVPGLSLSFEMGGAITFANVNFADNTLWGTGAGTNATIDNATVTDLGGGWARIWLGIHVSASDANTSFAVTQYCCNDGAASGGWTGAGNSNVLFTTFQPVCVWGDYQPVYVENTSTSAVLYTALAKGGTAATTAAIGVHQTGSVGDTVAQGGDGFKPAAGNAIGGGGGGAGGPSGAGSTASSTSGVGGAADNSTVAGGAQSTNGTAGTELGGTVGCGSGAGGRSGNGGGFTGGLYGGGGSGTGTQASQTGGSGAQALIVVTHNPPPPALDRESYQHFMRI